MKAKSFNHSSFAFLALCLCQGCSISSSTTILYMPGYELLIAGEAKAREGDWREAARIWNHLANSGSGPVCGKAAYNMVVICEWLDRRDLAIHWAQKTILAYNSTLARKRALDYLYFINEPLILDEKKGEMESRKN